MGGVTGARKYKARFGLLRGAIGGCGNAHARGRDVGRHRLVVVGEGRCRWERNKGRDSQWDLLKKRMGTWYIKLEAHVSIMGLWGGICRWLLQPLRTIIVHCLKSQAKVRA